MSLKPVLEVDLAPPDYSFDYLGIFYEEGKWWTGKDSGCSCPTPWQGFGSVTDLSGPYTAVEIRQQLRSLEPAAWSSYTPDAWVANKQSALKSFELILSEQEGN